jgi:hypothetical protein
MLLYCCFSCLLFPFSHHAVFPNYKWLKSTPFQPLAYVFGSTLILISFIFIAAPTKARLLASENEASPGFLLFEHLARVKNFLRLLLFFGEQKKIKEIYAFPDRSDKWLGGVCCQKRPLWGAPSSRPYISSLKRIVYTQIYVVAWH